MANKKIEKNKKWWSYSEYRRYLENKDFQMQESLKDAKRRGQKTDDEIKQEMQERLELALFAIRGY